nr:unnamed protein product [Digitaria exilis]
MLVLRFAAIVLAVAAIIFVAVDAQDSGQTFVDPQNSARAEVGVAPLAWDDTVVRRPGYYNCSDNSCSATGGSCRQYTQVVWENTTRVGCATVTCDAQQGTFVVCDYDPLGNLVGERPYAGCGQFNRSAQSSPQDLISLQNALRAGLGVGMLSWDSTLAAYAEAYAEKRKTDCQKIPSDGPYGENIFQGPQAPVPRMRSSPGSERSRTTTARPTNARVGKPAASTPSSSGQIRRESAVRLCERNL